MVENERIKPLNQNIEKSGTYVLYWMQAAQRAEYNHALEFAIHKANEIHKPVVTVFGLTDDYPEANLRHYQFMLEGLQEISGTLEGRGIQFVVKQMSPDAAAAELSQNACLVVTDAGHLKIQKQWRKQAANNMQCPLYEVEANLVVPITAASDKDDFSAGTFRPKITKQLAKFLNRFYNKKPKIDSFGLNFKGIDISDIDKVLSNLNIDNTVKPVEKFYGGTQHAKKLLKKFIRNKLDKYDELRNDPGLDYQSHLSPYLHFGQISPVYVAQQIKKTKSKAADAFLEELIVRRELSHNFVYYNDQYDSYEGLPDWAKRTLNFHKKDKREYHYTLEELEQAKTHDPYWNAAQTEMCITGKMHGYMRMYWGKKILEWSENPSTAFNYALYLNNKYELDGRDPNGYTGVAWCFGKHDRAWSERMVFGKTRYMNAKGLERKFNIEAYVDKIKNLKG